MSACVKCGTCRHQHARPFSPHDATPWCFECGSFLDNYPGHDRHCSKEESMSNVEANVVVSAVTSDQSEFRVHLDSDGEVRLGCSLTPTVELSYLTVDDIPVIIDALAKVHGIAKHLRKPGLREEQA